MSEELPILLAGPIIRRVTRSLSYLWLATSMPVSSATVELFVLKRSRGQATIRIPLPVRSDLETVQLGARLFVTIVGFQPRSRGLLPDETLFGYDLTVAVQTGISTEHHALNELLEGGLPSIRYPELGLPSFFIQREWSNPMRFLHGSCRKPHGGGEDSLAAADEFLENLSRETTSLDDRPSVLLLTGDQIYADDVADELIAHLAMLAVQLMGYEECIPGYAPPPIEYMQMDLAPYTREIIDAIYADREMDPRLLSDLNLAEDRPSQSRLARYIFHVRPVELLEPRYLRDQSRYRITTYPVSRLPGSRRQFVHTHAGFTTEDQNHLLTLGEYAAMYLMAWSTATWPERVLPNEDLERFRRRNPKGAAPARQCRNLHVLR